MPPLAARWSAADGPAVQLAVDRHAIDVAGGGTAWSNSSGSLAPPLSVPIPLIAAASRLPQSSDSNLDTLYPVSLYLYTFESLLLFFPKESDAVSFLEQVRRSADVASVSDFAAYEHPADEPTDGWKVYDAVAEFKRQGLGTSMRSWRISRINSAYTLCPSYPATLVVPAHVSDTTVSYAAKFRSKGRVPVLTYFHRPNRASISRASQPMTGIKQARNIQDEALVEAIFETHREPDAPRDVYGATKTNIIVDARTYTNAMANMAKGAGTEIMENYRTATKVHLGIDNIHAMRESLSRVVQELRKRDVGGAGGAIDQYALRQSGWLKHLCALLAGAVQVIKTVHVHSSHALVHCSDGWDRTSQIVSLAQICLDPYFRTCRGFAVLVEKDWMSFGHRFNERSGLVGFAAERFDLTPPPVPEPRTATEEFEELQEERTLGNFWDFTRQLTRSLNGGAAAQRAPIFFQFLDTVAQIVRQFPERFEYNHEFLAQIFRHVHSGCSGSFLHNTEQERNAPPRPAPNSTPSVWDSVLGRRELLNESYDASRDATDRDLGVLIPDHKDVLFTPTLFRHSDAELNTLIAADTLNQRRLAERLRSASGSQPVERGEEADDPLQAAAARMRSYLSTGWGRVQDAWRNFESGKADESDIREASPLPARHSEKPTESLSEAPQLHNPWASSLLAREVEAQTSYSLDPPRTPVSVQQVPPSPSPPPPSDTRSFDPLGVREM